MTRTRSRRLFESHPDSLFGIVDRDDRNIVD